MPDAPKEITLTLAAQRLSESYQTTHRRVLRGLLKGRRDDRGWLVETRSVDALLAARRAGQTPQRGAAA